MGSRVELFEQIRRDRDREGLEASYRLFIEAYDRTFDRTGLEWYRVESDVGMMGGFGAHEYMAPCAAGENDVALSESGYAANVEIASAEPRPVDGLPAAADEPKEAETPGATTIEAVCSMLGVPAGALIKAFPVFVDDRVKRVGDLSRHGAARGVIVGGQGLAPSLRNDRVADS